MRTFATLAALVSSAALISLVPSVAVALEEDVPSALRLRSHEAKAKVAIKAKAKKHNKDQGNWTPGIKITWYGAEQLKNPACGGSDPSPHDLIAATLSPERGGLFACGDVVSLKNEQGRNVKVKILDYCEGCERVQLDLSRGAYSALTGHDTDGDVGKVQYQIVTYGSKKRH